MLKRVSLKPFSTEGIKYGFILIQPTLIRQAQVEVKASFHINNATGTLVN